MKTIFAKKLEEGNSIGVTLDNHTKMVINVGLFLAKKYIDFGDYEFDFDRMNLRKNFFEFLSIALLSHDIGKITDKYQKILINNSDINKIKKNDEFIPHEIASYFFLKSCVKYGDNDVDDSILFSVLNHHVYDSSFIVDNRFEKFEESDLSTMKEFFNNMKDYVTEKFSSLRIDLSNYTCRERQNKNELPHVNKLFSEIIINNPYQRKNAHLTNYNVTDMFNNEMLLQLIRAILIKSDRLVSSLLNVEDGEAKQKSILDNDEDCINNLITSEYTINDQNIKLDFESHGYDLNRLNMQIDILKDTESNNHNVISASAGFGKTLIGLMWFCMHKKKIFWASPRNSLCINNFESIKRELTKLGIQDKVKVCLFYGGKIQKRNVIVADDENDDVTNYDIVVSNIDGLLNRLTHNNIGHLLFNMYSSDIIFDEYHEFVSDKGGLFSVFARMMYIRTRFTNSKTLLLSATPSKLDCLIGEGYIKYINKRNILNEHTRYNIKCLHLKNLEDLYKCGFDFNDKSVSIIAKTVKDSQKLYGNYTPNNNTCMLYHSLFTEEDKENKLNTILNENGKDGIDIDRRHNVISTNMVGTGLDITFRTMFDFIVSHETTIQRACGRMNRFGETDEVNYYVCEYESKFHMYDKKLSSKWIEYLKEYDNQTITRRKLYELYDKFITENERDIKSYYINCFNKSSNDLQDVKTRKVSIKKSTDGNKPLSQNKNIRGESTSLYVIAKNENEDSFSKPIIIEVEKVKNFSNENNFCKIRKEYIKKEYAKALEKNKYIYFEKGKVDGVISSLTEFAKVYPIPLYSVKYSSEKGLYEEDE